MPMNPATFTCTIRQQEWGLLSRYLFSEVDQVLGDVVSFLQMPSIYKSQKIRVLPVVFELVNHKGPWARVSLELPDAEHLDVSMTLLKKRYTRFFDIVVDAFRAHGVYLNVTYQDDLPRE